MMVLLLIFSRLQLLWRSQGAFRCRHHRAGENQSAGDRCRRALFLEYRRWTTKLRARYEIQPGILDQSDGAETLGDPLSRETLRGRPVSRDDYRFLTVSVD